ncbi:AAA domain-containing protein [Niallia circulans]|uniref:AAA domain-containing protein n=1 Tax=Niallia circulans TaxID=1397 RepID=UPI00351687C0
MKNIIKKITSNFFNTRIENKSESEEQRKDVASKVLNYFIQLEQFNIVKCDQNYITLNKFRNFFQNDILNDYEFIGKQGNPRKYMDIFLQKGGKSKYLLNEEASLLYIPISEVEIQQHLSNQTNKKRGYTENIRLQSQADGFLIQIKLNHMLKIPKDNSLNNLIFISPILTSFLNSGIELKDLQKDLENTLIELLNSERYGRIDKSFTYESSDYPDLEKGLKFINVRLKNWELITEEVQNLVYKYINKKYLDKEGVLRFTNRINHASSIKLTYENSVGINSFYEKDLIKIHRKLESNELGTALRNYLHVTGWEILRTSNKRIDFLNNKNIDEIKTILEKMPPTRWPSKYPLGLMQQVALNIIYDKAKEEQGFIFSVNGPPGTGKTTLLKDIFANILYQKVKFLKNNTNIITERIRYGKNDNDYYFSLHRELKKYRILIASSNNSAVENISIELPKDEDLLKNDYKFGGFDQEQQIWGKISAAMGKKSNKEKYFSEILDDFSRIHNLYTEHCSNFDNLEESIQKQIYNAKPNNIFNDIDDEDWQTSKVQFLDIDGEKDKINCDRSQLFNATLIEYVRLLIKNKEELMHNLQLAELYFMNKGIEKRIEEGNRDNFIQTMFDTIFLITPILSSTFASMANFLKDLEQEDIGWLFIDEAGQASPQDAIGSIWRAKNVIVVGDPLQVPPVVSLSSSQLQSLAKSASMCEEDSYFFKLTSPEMSVQEFADLGNIYGGEMVDSKGNSIWLGSPLRVHRRCENPMFQICNDTTYKGKMIFGTEEYNKIRTNPLYTSQWIDIRGEALKPGNHYVNNQGEKAFDVAKVFAKENPGKTCYMISPFKTVVDELKKLNKRNNVENLEIGTVHTFQGKQAPLVIFVLGVADNNTGPLIWASSTPNLLNVAASRAMKHFVVIGNKKTWGSKQYFENALMHLTK